MACAYSELPAPANLYILFEWEILIAHSSRLHQVNYERFRSTVDALTKVNNEQHHRYRPKVS